MFSYHLNPIVSYTPSESFRQTPLPFVAFSPTLQSSNHPILPPRAHHGSLKPLLHSSRRIQRSPGPHNLASEPRAPFPFLPQSPSRRHLLDRLTRPPNRVHFPFVQTRWRRRTRWRRNFDERRQRGEPLRCAQSPDLCLHHALDAITVHPCGDYPLT